LSLLSFCTFFYYFKYYLAVDIFFSFSCFLSFHFILPVSTNSSISSYFICFHTYPQVDVECCFLLIQPTEHFISRHTLHKIVALWSPCNNCLANRYSIRLCSLNHWQGHSINRNMKSKSKSKSHCDWRSVNQ
jgi:hypothetical protein